MSFRAKEMTTTLLDKANIGALNSLHHIGKPKHAKTEQKNAKSQFLTKITTAQCFGQILM